MSKDSAEATACFLPDTAVWLTPHFQRMPANIQMNFISPETMILAGHFLL